MDDIKYKGMEFKDILELIEYFENRIKFLNTKIEYLEHTPEWVKKLELEK